jgi:hypothetical protein
VWERATEQILSSRAFQDFQPILRGFHRSPHKGGDMKKQALTLITVLSLLLAAGSAYAQTIWVKVDVPFKFSVNKETMPAGQYTIESLGTDRVLLIRNSDSKPMTILIANSIQSQRPSEQTRLVFTHYADQYFLSQVWVAGNDLGHQLPKGAREKELAMNYSPEGVIVLAELK